MLLGIDDGSTTAKIAIVDTNKKLLFSEYRRHLAEQGECVFQLLELVERRYPEARTAIELGGQDAKIIFFHYDRVSQQLIAPDMRMNGLCAGGI